jgi:transcriptional regulator GlxA family with amidase domain
VAIRSQVPLCHDRRLQRVIELIVNDMSRQLTLAQVANIAGLERTYFCRRFQETVGLNFSHWNRHIRIESAKHLLATTDLPVTAVGFAVGYEDITTFARNFRRCVDLSPREYRRNQRHAQRTHNITTFAENSTTIADNFTRNAETIANSRG